MKGFGKRWAGVVAGLVAAAVAGFAAPASSARTWTVLAGGLSRDGSVVSNAFHPRVLDVGVGDVVEWRFEGFHNVAFAGEGPLPPLLVREGASTYLNPRVAFPAGPQTFAGAGYRNSGVPPDDPASIARFRYRLRFTAPGTYTYTCVVHGPAMSGAVRVHPVGARLLEDPQAALRRGRKEQQATLGTCPGKA
jgi:plastocyanin